MENVGSFSSLRFCAHCKNILLHPFYLTLCYLCSAELVQKEAIHYNDLVEKYVHSDHVNSALPNNSSPEEGNRSCFVVHNLL
jgi:hypothetical protein